MNRSFFCSWSGGKDSCFALYKAIKMSMKPSYLLTMMTEDPDRSRSHGLRKTLLESQAKSIGIPLIMKSTTWEKYEEDFIEQLKIFSAEGITDGVFGDIDLQEHKDWVEKVSKKANITPHEPLWKLSREELVTDFLKEGFKAKIVSVKGKALDMKYLGHDLTFDLLKEFKKIGIDLAGENGEYHSYVYDGPIFKQAINIVEKEKIKRDGYTFMDFEMELKA